MKIWIAGFKGKFRDLSLPRKMIFLYIISLFAPLLILSTFYINNLSGRLHEQYKRNKYDILEQAQYSIETNMLQVTACTNSFQFNANLIRYVEGFDFSSADGAELYMKTVKPAFDQLKSTNPEFSKITIWRKDARELNDPHFVLNAQDNSDLETLENLNYKNLKAFIFEEDGVVNCRIYKALFNINHFYKIGYVEVVSKFDYLFQPLNFLGEDEVVILRKGDESYQIKKDDQGKLNLTSYQTEPSYKNKAEVPLEKMDMVLEYYYPNFKVMSNESVLSLYIGFSLLFLFFTFVYYMFYFSITKRITILTDHMKRFQVERMTPYKDDPSKDEIGTMIRVYNQTADRMNRLIDEIYQKERLVNQAQYYAMQSQIHPHFLYNTLENIDMLIEVGENRKASQMIALFGRILRYNTSRCQELASLGEEMTHIEDYLKLYSFRMREDFYYDIQIEESCKDIPCPYCMLQPVIENCFKHGFKYEERELWIKVRAFMHGDYVVVEIEDNGSGVEGERIDQINKELNAKSITKQDSSIGLQNVHQRIKILCGEDCGLWIRAIEQGCLVWMLLKNQS